MNLVLFNPTVGPYTSSVIQGIKVSQVESTNKTSRAYIKGKGILIKWAKGSSTCRWQRKQFIDRAVKWAKNHFAKKKKRVAKKKSWKRTLVKGYSVYDLPYKNKAATMLAQIERAVKPILKRFNLSYTTIKESVAEGSLGFNRGRRIIALNLRQREDHKKFRKFSAVMSTMIHELAHLRHMNHGPQFKAFDTEMKNWAKKQGIYQPGAVGPPSKLPTAAKTKPVKKPAKKPAKKPKKTTTTKKPLTAYQKFVKQKRAAGYSMKEIGALWRNKK